MNISVETRRWRRMLRLFHKDGEGIEELTHRLECALNQTPPGDRTPLILTWNDMVSVVFSVVEAAVAVEGENDAR